MLTEPVSIATTACSNCGAETLGPFCHACGQKREERLSFRSVLSNLKEQFAHLDFALWRTFRGLLLDPGRVATEYVAGRRRDYTNPFKYAFLTATLYALSMSLVEFDPHEEGALQLAASVAPLLPYLAFPMMLPIAALQRWALRRDTEYNTAECYVFLVFVLGQVFLYGSGLALLGTRVPRFSIMLVQMVVLAWGLARFHRIKGYVAFLVAWMVVGAGNVLIIALGILLAALWGAAFFS